MRVPCCLAAAFLVDDLLLLEVAGKHVQGKDYSCDDGGIGRNACDRRIPVHGGPSPDNSANLCIWSALPMGTRVPGLLISGQRFLLLTECIADS